MEIEIFYHDLNDEGKKKFVKVYHDNIDIAPIAIINIDDDVVQENNVNCTLSECYAPDKRDCKTCKWFKQTNYVCKKERVK